jgi:beta-lactamase superfamily II metal-dependent hydrolase
MAASIAFVGYPAAVLVNDNREAVMQKLWGSFLPLTGKKDGDWLQVKMGDDRFWIHKNETQPDGILEIMFLDIGQGDGCLLNIPQQGSEPRRMIIDAGASDNMIRFLAHKYQRSQKPVNFEAFIITHPDEDHYFGFDPILDSPDFKVQTIYHSGLVERVASTSSDSLGPRKKLDGRAYVTDLIATKADLDQLLTPARVGKKQYPRMMRKAVDSSRVADIRMINATDGHLPGCGPEDDVTLEILGPVPENVDSGKPALRWLSDVGKTKNGHSVVIRLIYGKVSILLGGDLNIPAEEYLLEHYTGEHVPPRTVEDEERLIRKAQRVFQSDFAKSCHHGSADFTEFFLQAVNAHATVISSGDDEPHAHPRADTLGTVGKHSRGRRSLIFSTELARSTRETIRNADEFRETVRQAAADLEAANKTGVESKISAAKEKFDAILNQIERSVTTFGAINMRTDGDRVVFAYKIERPRDEKSQWDIYKFERDSAGDLVFQSKH